MTNKAFSINLNFDSYKDRVYACWLGKNIGGTLGGPYEGVQHTLDVRDFSSEAGKPRPNDDLDLQLIWLHAVERLGPLAINAQSLGEFWISLLPPNWNEYGIGRNNMKRGLPPPISGEYQNEWKHSNGAWIRTEIWACLAPGCPALAAKYAMEDAKVDHGMGEGTMAAAFVSAMQSAAFVLKSLRSCMELGLALLPAECRVADSVRFVLDCYDRKMSAMEARNAIFQRNSDIGDGWFEAPSNLSYALIGLLWGEGDFKSSLLTTLNCGDDTDCTTATVGSTLGILKGTQGIPEDWLRHVGDDIVTISINKSDNQSGSRVPKTCTELTQRVVAQAPLFLFANRAKLSLSGEADQIPEEARQQLFAQCQKHLAEACFAPYTVHYQSACLCADLTQVDGPDISPLEEKTIEVRVYPLRPLGDELMNLTHRWWLPEGFSLTQGRQSSILFHKCSHYSGKTHLRFTVKAGESIAPVNRLVLELMPEGRYSPLYIPVVFLG